MSLNDTKRNASTLYSFQWAVDNNSDSCIGLLSVSKTRWCDSIMSNAWKLVAEWMPADGIMEICNRFDHFPWRPHWHPTWAERWQTIRNDKPTKLRWIRPKCVTDRKMAVKLIGNSESKMWRCESIRKYERPGGSLGNKNWERTESWSWNWWQLAPTWPQKSG